MWPRYQQHIICDIEGRIHDDTTFNNRMLDKNRNGEGWICFLIFANGKGDSFKIEGVIPDEN